MTDAPRILLGINIDHVATIRNARYPRLAPGISTVGAEPDPVFAAHEAVLGGADIITVHPEAGPHIHRTLQAIRGAGCKVGLALNPGTPVEAVEHLLDLLDLVCVMTVNPGFGGQKFIPETLNKLRAARAKLDAYEERSGRRILLEIDGGVKTDNIAEIARAGADTFVAGSAVFGAAKASDPHRYDTILGALRAELAAVKA